MVSGLHDEPQTLAEVGYVACGLFVQVVVLEGDVLMDAAVSATLFVARLKMRQRFRNQGSHWADGCVGLMSV